MDVLVKHEGTTVTDQVISYEREHRICTGIGTLRIVFEDTTSEEFNPGDTVDIHENGDFKVRYYVTAISHSVPEATITLECQDKSKYLVDYFIPQSYIIDFPSYTRTWIEEFLDQAGISYQFQTNEQGNLLSNFTQLGLQSAYDQVLMLLQLSGWYMYFDGNGVAQIGSLKKEFSDPDGSIVKHDIISASKSIDDKMSRNRAVVWGAYDPLLQEFAYADVHINTRWAYDDNDLRTMVVSNSNIPNKGSAFKIANILLKEFSTLTIEKHLVCWDALDYQLGDVLKVASDVWSGKGIVTTFGTSMSRNGLVTNIILDERCPRLFGFFDFGDYVYVATFGDGIWRKHVRFDPTWYDFSSGLLNMEITDLHITSGVFTSVGNSGQMYYTISEEGPWLPHSVVSLESSDEDTIESASGLVLVPYSGLKARATIIDREANMIMWGIDNWSGENMGDYFIQYPFVSDTFFGAEQWTFPSGITTFSGTAISGLDLRGWVVQFDPITSIETDYPISVSGNYNITVIDLENDGYNDYVSVCLHNATNNIPPTSINYNFGFHSTQPFAYTKDMLNERVVTPLDLTNLNSNPDSSTTFTTPVATTNSLVAMDNPASNMRRVMSIGKLGNFRRTSITRDFNEISELYEIHTSEVNKTGGPTFSNSYRIIGIQPDFFQDIFTIFYYKNTSTNIYTYYYMQWNANTNELGPETIIGQADISYSSVTPDASNVNNFDIIDVGGTIYHLIWRANIPSTVGGFHVSPSFLNIDMVRIGKAGRTFVYDHILEVQTEEFNGSGKYFWFDDTGLGVSDTILIDIFQSQTTVQVLGWAKARAVDGLGNFQYKEYIFSGGGVQVNPGVIYDQPVDRIDTTGGNFISSQIDHVKGMIGRFSSTAGLSGFVYDGDIFQLLDPNTQPFYLNNSPAYDSGTKNIFAVLGYQGFFVSRNPSDDKYYLMSSSDFVPLTQIYLPASYIITLPYSTIVPGSSPKMFFQVNVIGDRRITPYNFNTFDTTNEINPDGLAGSTVERATNFGGIVMMEPSSFSGSDPLATVFYMDLGEVEDNGTRYLVLQREDTDFNIVQEAPKPIRVEISNNSPLVTVQDDEVTFRSFYIHDQDVTEVLPTIVISGIVSTSGLDVFDYRYTLLEQDFITFSGISMELLYLSTSGVYEADVATLSGFILFDSIPSGIPARIETTNYVSSGQYIFVTTSGEDPTFYQRDPGNIFWDTYSGLPDSRTTIIRIDDRL